MDDCLSPTMLTMIRMMLIFRKEENMLLHDTPFERGREQMKFTLAM